MDHPAASSPIAIGAAVAAGVIKSGGSPVSSDRLVEYDG